MAAPFAGSDTMDQVRRSAERIASHGVGNESADSATESRDVMECRCRADVGSCFRSAKKGILGRPVIWGKKFISRMTLMP